MKEVELETSLVKDAYRTLTDASYSAPKDKDSLRKYLAEYEKTKKLSERKRDILNACVKRWHHRKWLEYVTSPESETYWCS